MTWTEAARAKRHPPMSDDQYKDRLRARVAVSVGGCWLWQGYANDLGYSQVFCRGKRWMTHRLAYALWKGPVADDMQVCHTCDKPSCINPDHLWLGTNLANQIDSLQKRRHANARKTHCPHGHSYAEHGERRADGRRNCRACHAERMAGRQIVSVHNAAKTHCNYGHPLSGDNLYVTPGDGRRQCRVCRTESTRRRARILKVTSPRESV